MLHVRAQSTNEAYPLMIKGVLRDGVLLPSRVSPAQEVHPAVVEIEDTRDRLVTAFGRPVNVAFALAEVLWILQGRKDVEMLKHYNNRISDYSDDGVSFNAAYGDRLRYSFRLDQLAQVERILREDPESRQASLVLSHPFLDRGYNKPSAEGSKHTTKDRACNVYGHLMIRDGRLDWLQVIRSNDALWGTPYNWMQFMHLQEFIATRLDIPTGKYTHVVDSLHIYDYHLAEAHNIEGFDLYRAVGHRHAPMQDVRERTMAKVFQAEQDQRKGDPESIIGLPEYWHAVITLLTAQTAYKQGRDEDALDIVLNSDEVFAPAQVRFWYHHRWHQPHHSDIMESVHDAFPEHVYNWIISSAAA